MSEQLTEQLTEQLRLDISTALDESDTLSIGRLLADIDIAQTADVLESIHPLLGYLN